MCVKCNGTGRVASEFMPGAYYFAPCSCEHSMQQRQVLEQELADLRQRLAMARARFSAERKAN
ncbi:hypothetical protein [Thermaerobacillus caldiproteolyticus]|uniref:hypothetical protein n=1 Tax=Thermaerobacillus caldiproteolyticus TaxID=247480 RepID=UPI001F429DF9|nr:hypothetical protein [Anoxybacillus caldiproteolyticus]